MSSSWFYEINGKRYGPISFRSLKVLAATNRLKPADLVWQDDTSMKCVASSIDGLFDELPRVEKRAPASLPQPQSSVTGGSGQISLVCSRCGFQFKVAEEFAGREGRCPNPTCGKTCSVPQPSAGVLVSIAKKKETAIDAPAPSESRLLKLAADAAKRLMIMLKKAVTLATKNVQLMNLTWSLNWADEAAGRKAHEHRVKEQLFSEIYGRIGVIDECLATNRKATPTHTTKSWIDTAKRMAFEVQKKTAVMLLLSKRKSCLRQLGAKLRSNAESPDAQILQEELKYSRSIQSKFECLTEEIASLSRETPGLLKKVMVVSALTGVLLIACLGHGFSLGTDSFAGTKAGEAKELVPGINFRWCPAGQFTMGSPKSELGDNNKRYDDEDQVDVRFSFGFWLSETEVTQGQWQELMGTTPWHGGKLVKEGGNYAASYISHDDAMEFLEKLTSHERSAKRLSKGWKYALPTEAQWEYACRAGTNSKYSFGDNESELGEYGWFKQNGNDAGEHYAHRVGQKKPNAWGLRDMHGNVWEWCSDWYSHSEKPFGGTDPVGASSGSYRVNRGGGWSYDESNCRAALRNFRSPGARGYDIGFRVAVIPSRLETGAKGAVDQPRPTPLNPTQPLSTKHGPFAGSKAGDPKELVPGINFRWCPAGEFTMGAPGALGGEVKVTLSSGFWLGETEITQDQWQKVMGTSPWKGKEHVKEGADYAASYISHDDAVAYCAKLTTQERAANRLPDNWMYALPTEAQWEYSCRAGTKTKYSFGDDESQLGECGWWGGIGGDGNAKTEKYAHRVGQKKANAWGLRDMHGNVWEWCSDWNGEKLSGGADPLGTSSGSYRVVRGGSWDCWAVFCLSAYRSFGSPGDRFDYLGFRVAGVPSRSSAPEPDSKAGTGATQTKSGKGDELNPTPKGNEKVDQTAPVTDFNETIQLDPKDATAYTSRGIALVGKGDHNAAIKDFTEAIRRNPKDDTAYTFRGLAWGLKGDSDAAIEDYNEAIRLKPNDSPAYVGRGGAWNNKRDFDAAIKDFTNAIRIDPKLAVAYSNRGLSWHSKGDFDAAIKDCTEAIRLDSKLVAAYNNRGLAWLSKGNFNAAIKDYTESIRLDPKNAVAYGNRGGAWNSKKDFDAAIKDCTEAIRIDPKLAMAYSNRGLSWLSKGDFNAAIKDCTAAIRIDPQLWMAHGNRGYAWLGKSDFDAAIKDFTEAIRLNPKEQEYKKSLENILKRKKERP